MTELKIQKYTSLQKEWVNMFNLIFCNKKKVYDVTDSPFYKPNEMYHLFAGNDASYALAKYSLEKQDLNKLDLSSKYFTKK